MYVPLHIRIRENKILKWLVVSLLTVLVHEICPPVNVTTNIWDRTLHTRTALFCSLVMHPTTIIQWHTLSSESK